MTENFTMIPNKILDALPKASLNATQKSIIEVVERSTYGYNKKSHTISITYITNKTGINKSQIARELRKLIEMKVIKVYKNQTNNKSRELGINENIEEWQTKSKQNASIKLTNVNANANKDIIKQGEDIEWDKLYTE